MPVKSTFSIKLLHHELPADLIAQEKCSVSRESADHGRGETGVERPHSYATNTPLCSAHLTNETHLDKGSSHRYAPSVRAMVVKVLKNPACFPVTDMTWIRDLTLSMG